MKLSLRWTALLVCALAGANGAEPSPSRSPLPSPSATPSPINYDQPPVTRFDYGLVRVWNAKSDPPESAGHVPEATLGDTILAEIKNIDQWVCANLDAGAWSNDEYVSKASPAVQKLIETHKLWPAVQAGKWLRTKNSEPPSATPESAAVADEKNVRLLAELKTALKLAEDALPARDDNDNPLDAGKPTDARRIVAICEAASRFIPKFLDHKAGELVLSINDTRLPGLPVAAMAKWVKWKAENVEEGNYTSLQIKLRASDNPDSDTAWTNLMRAAAPHFSLPSRLSVSMPGELLALGTNVTPDAEDSRCRFILIAIPQAERVPKKLAKGDAVYPLDVRERMNEIKKGEVVEVDDQTPTAPYIVHFSDAGGSKHYASEDLARLPPNPVLFGVVRVWNLNNNTTEWEQAQRNEIPAAKIGDPLGVEVVNFDGWLCHQVDQGLLHEEPLLQKVSKKVAEFINAKNFASAVKVGGLINDLAGTPSNTAADIVRALQKRAPHDADLAPLSFPSVGPAPPIQIKVKKNATVSATPTPTPAPEDVEAVRKAEKDAKDFLAPYQEANSVLRDLVKAKLRALNLTINDLVLDVVPDNSDFAPINKTRRPPADPKEDTYHWLHFVLAPKPSAAAKDDDKTAADPFKRLLEKPSFLMPSKVTLTLKSGSETLTLPTAVTPQAKDDRCKFNLIGIRQWMFWTIAAVFGIIALTLIVFAATTDILRDPCRRRPEGVEPVSLARTQMAFWFVVIAAAFLFLWVTTGNYATINSTCLVLLAIGTTTALTSATISGSNTGKGDLAEALQKTPHEMLKMTPLVMQTEIAARKTQIEAGTAGDMTPEEKARQLAILETHRKEIQCFLDRAPSWLPKRGPLKAVYFWKYRLRTVFEDLLTEEAGTYDFHRFQILAWTLILGSVFIVKVFYDRIMPTFDSNVLLLMGLSSGAYLGFKKVATDRTEEKNKEQQTSFPPPVAASAASPQP
jgi:hypothetical protein